MSKMIFNKHELLEGSHAPFSASKSHWLRYDDEKLVDVYRNMKASELGTALHAWAKTTIDLGIKQPRTKKTIANYVNDAIGYQMSTEVVLYYSKYFYGTTDSISFRDNFLRIHDLKTGTIPANMEQLRVYAALFCLEYRVRPGDIEIELRIYQNDEVVVDNPTADDIAHIMDDIIHKNKVLQKLEENERSI